MLVSPPYFIVKIHLSPQICVSLMPCQRAVQNKKGGAGTERATNHLFQLENGPMKNDNNWGVRGSIKKLPAAQDQDKHLRVGMVLDLKLL